MYRGPKFGPPAIARVYSRRQGAISAIPAPFPTGQPIVNLGTGSSTERLQGVQSRLPKHGCLPEEPAVPPSSSHHSDVSAAPPDDLGERDRAGAAAGRPRGSSRAAGRPLPARTDPRLDGGELREEGLRRDHDRRRLRAGGRLPRHLLRAVQGQGGLLPRRDGALAGRSDGPHRRRLLARQALGDDGARRRRHLPRPARQPARLRPHGPGRGAVLGRARLRALRLRQAGAAIAARTRPRRSGRGTGDPLQRRARRALRRGVADRRPDPRRQHRAPARAAARHRLHHDGSLPRPGGGAAPVAPGGEASVAPADG